MLYEAAALGVPAIVLCQNAAQQREAELFARAGAVINLGTYEQGHEQFVRQSLTRLLSDNELLSSMSENGRKLVSLNGASSIVDKIVSIARSFEESSPTVEPLPMPSSAVASHTVNSFCEVIR